MKLALALFHYFPYGGLERDMLATAREAKARGHELCIFTARWGGELPADIQVVELPVRGLANHVRARRFAQRFAEAMRTFKPHCTVGFNRMPGLDYYFAADTCYARKVQEERGWLYRQLPRCRQYLSFEAAVYGAASTTRILALTGAQIREFQHYYGTPDARFHLLPPGIRQDRVMPTDYAQRRRSLRRELGLQDDQQLLLMVGSDFRRKGLARSIAAVAKLPHALRSRVQLWVAGKGDGRPFEQLAASLGVGEQLKILGARDDVPQLLWAADLLLHPAHSEAAGAVLIEAMVAGLPVLATEVCGYAPWIVEAGMGQVVPNTADASSLAAGIETLLQVGSVHWREQAQALVARNTVFAMHEQMVSYIEAHCRSDGSRHD